MAAREYKLVMFIVVDMVLADIALAFSNWALFAMFALAVIVLSVLLICDRIDSATKPTEQ